MIYGGGMVVVEWEFFFNYGLIGQAREVDHECDKKNTIAQK